MHTGGGAHMGHGGMDHMHHPQPTSGEGERGPTFGQHNQMIVGEKTIYLSHLPMFMFDPEHHEHSFQVILEATFSGPGDPQATYVADRRQHPDVRMYTMRPAEFEMIELDPQNPRRQALTGAIFRGHLERGGEVIIPQATAEVVNTVYFNRLEENAAPFAQLEYLLVGKEPELFLVHLLSRPPDFDQILAVTLIGEPSPALTDDALARGVRISIPGRANTPPTRVKAGEQVEGVAHVDGASASQSVQLRAATEFYFEEGELGDPELPEGRPGAVTFERTPEEKLAGF